MLNDVLYFENGVSPLCLNLFILHVCLFASRFALHVSCACLLVRIVLILFIKLILVGEHIPVIIFGFRSSSRLLFEAQFSDIVVSYCFCPLIICRSRTSFICPLWTVFPGLWPSSFGVDFACQRNPPILSSAVLRPWHRNPLPALFGANCSACAQIQQQFSSFLCVHDFRPFQAIRRIFSTLLAFQFSASR